MIKVTFSVPDMHCANCAMRLQELEDSLPGVKRVNASYHKQKMEVEFDETCLTIEQIIAAVKTSGYTAKRVGE